MNYLFYFIKAIVFLTLVISVKEAQNAKLYPKPETVDFSIHFPKRKFLAMRFDRQNAVNRNPRKESMWRKFSIAVVIKIGGKKAEPWVSPVMINTAEAAEVTYKNSKGAFYLVCNKV